METIHIMNYIRPLCYGVLAIGAITLLVKRGQKRLVTYREIEKWARSVCSDGDICHMSLLSSMPDDVKDNVRKQNGVLQILNGYREETSVFVTVTDSLNNIKNTTFFMGKSLDEELKSALSSEVEHRIKF